MEACTLFWPSRATSRIAWTPWLPVRARRSSRSGTQNGYGFPRPYRTPGISPSRRRRRAAREPVSSRSFTSSFTRSTAIGAQKCSDEGLEQLALASCVGHVGEPLVGNVEVPLGALRCGEVGRRFGRKFAEETVLEPLGLVAKDDAGQMQIRLGRPH